VNVEGGKEKMTWEIVHPKKPLSCFKQGDWEKRKNHGTPFHMPGDQEKET